MAQEDSQAPSAAEHGAAMREASGAPVRGRRAETDLSGDSSRRAHAALNWLKIYSEPSPSPDNQPHFWLPMPSLPENLPANKTTSVDYRRELHGRSAATCQTRLNCVRLGVQNSQAKLLEPQAGEGIRTFVLSLEVVNFRSVRCNTSAAFSRHQYFLLPRPLYHQN